MARVTDGQVRKLMEELSRHGSQGLAALRAGMDRKTARRYERTGKLPSELNDLRRWRTRPDPFEADWERIKARLRDAPDLEAKILFEDLMAQNSGRYEPGQLRTLQRRIKQWRAEEGPPKEVYFAQMHRPGEAMQTDFTSANELGITIGGEAFEHLLCHPVLPYSNWEWVTVCRSESMMAMRRGVQSFLFTLGRKPQYHQTDNSTAATHEIRPGKRVFNEEYKRFVAHVGMTPRTIGIGESHQNGDVEAAHGAFKRRAKQHLLLRGSSDFESVDAYEDWLQTIAQKANLLRQKKVNEELSVMQPVLVKRLPEYSEVDVKVTSWSTIRVNHNTYSVPSRLINEWIRVRAYDDRLEVYYAQKQQFSMPRLLGRNGRTIDYRHIIWSLMRKPGAFARYKYRDALFPTLTFRKTYDVLSSALSGFDADINYLRILHLAASTMEFEVDAALLLLLEQNQLPYADTVKALVAPETPTIPAMPAYAIDLSSYDKLLAQEVAP